jgi:hypothetical protein
VTRRPRTTYGGTLVDEVLAVDPDATFWNTDGRGKPDMVHLAHTDYPSSGAEAGICTANRRVAWQVVHGHERRGSPPADRSGNVDLVRKLDCSPQKGRRSP